MGLDNRVFMLFVHEYSNENIGLGFFRHAQVLRANLTYNFSSSQKCPTNMSFSSPYSITGHNTQWLENPPLNIQRNTQPIISTSTHVSVRR